MSVPVHIPIGSYRRQGPAGVRVFEYLTRRADICGFVRHKETLYIFYGKAGFGFAVSKHIETFVGPD